MPDSVSMEANASPVDSFPCFIEVTISEREYYDGPARDTGTCKSALDSPAGAIVGKRQKFGPHHLIKVVIQSGRNRAVAVAGMAHQS